VPLKALYCFNVTSPLATLSGCPVINVPAGFEGSLPMGLLIIGRPRADIDVLRLAKAYEANLPFEAGVSA